jgi:hypothetical protein
LNRVSTLAVGCNSELWIGLGSLWDNTGAGIDVLDAGGDPHDLGNDTWGEPFRHPPLPSDLITSIAPDCGNGQLWVSGVPYFSGSRIEGGGVGVYDYDAEQWTVYDKINGIQSYTEIGIMGEAQSITVGPDRAVWVGTWGTFATSHEDMISHWPYVPAVINWSREGRWFYETFERDGWVSSIAVDIEGAIWVGTSRGGMDMDQDGQEENYEIDKAAGGIKLTLDGTNWVGWSPNNSPLVSNDVEVIAVAPDGDVWVGTNGWGLMRFHPGESIGVVPTRTRTPAAPISTPGPGDTPTPTSTAPTSTTTAVPATPTATLAIGSIPQQVYLPMVARNR